METYLNAFIRAAQEGKDFCGMPAWEVKIIVEDMLKERNAAIASRDAAIRQECAEKAIEYCESNRLTKGWQDELRAACRQGR